jgi:predicted nucleic acid binding AN1-type Zn finger protein
LISQFLKLPQRCPQTSKTFSTEFKHEHPFPAKFKLYQSQTEKSTQQKTVSVIKSIHIQFTFKSILNKSCSPVDLFAIKSIRHQVYSQSNATWIEKGKADWD